MSSSPAQGTADGDLIVDPKLSADIRSARATNEPLVKPAVLTNSTAEKIYVNGRPLELPTNSPQSAEAFSTSLVSSYGTQSIRCVSSLKQAASTGPELGLQDPFRQADRQTAPNHSAASSWYARAGWRHQHITSAMRLCPSSSRLRLQRPDLPRPAGPKRLSMEMKSSFVLVCCSSLILHA